MEKFLMQIECDDDDVFHVPNLQMAKAFRLTSQTTTTIIIILNCFSPDTQLMYFPTPLDNSIDELKEEHRKKSCDSLYELPMWFNCLPITHNTQDT